ncbi:hypothetical protein GF351_02655 [Candidatus Woesearchaeota archaeon]|nr:hypothetical protein [Candidatus Woesearchaeota archaeon]
MSFETEKNFFLAKTDKNRKGRIDSRYVLSAIMNSLKVFCMTSSCSGRTGFVSVSPSGKKNRPDDQQH